jgi:hypothetical protein
MTQVGTSSLCCASRQNALQPAGSMLWAPPRNFWNAALSMPSFRLPRTVLMKALEK